MNEARWGRGRTNPSDRLRPVEQRVTEEEDQEKNVEENKGKQAEKQEEIGRARKVTWHKISK